MNQPYPNIEHAMLKALHDDDVNEVQKLCDVWNAHPGCLYKLTYETAPPVSLWNRILHAQFRKMWSSVK